MWYKRTDVIKPDVVCAKTVEQTDQTCQVASWVRVTILYHRGSLSWVFKVTQVALESELSDRTLNLWYYYGVKKTLVITSDTDGSFFVMCSVWNVHSE